MFGLTRREQRWKAEQKAVETVIPLLTAAIQAGTASRDIDDEKNKAVAAATAPLLARIAELEQELAEARKDAERYLFAADPQSDGYAVCEWNDGDWIPINTEDLDAAIKEQT